MDEDKQATVSFDPQQINEQALVKYERDYSEVGLKEKILQYGKGIGMETLYKVLQLWLALRKPEVPAETKAVIVGALGYLIAPLDFLPDLTPVLGSSDDVLAITFALFKVSGYIDDEVKQEAKFFLSKIFGAESVKELE